MQPEKEPALTREPQYQNVYEVVEKHGVSKLGLMVNQVWNEDPRRTLFTLARYKFVAKMFEGRKNVLEIGCADAFGTRIVQQTVGAVTAIDFDPVFIEDAKSRMNPHWPFAAFVHDMLTGPVQGSFDGIFALDVLEHIKPGVERQFLENAFTSLDPHGIAIFGMPSLESQDYASPQSKEGHVNCKSMPDFKRLMESYFHSVFMFSMNDETVHTGFHKLAHYLFAVAADPKR
jgi:2-polyprenyl-3-methyl-5-hydroxy-6-metoxy-1,4-benzoquinol methylase